MSIERWLVHGVWIYIYFYTFVYLIAQYHHKIAYTNRPWPLATDLFTGSSNVSQVPAFVIQIQFCKIYVALFEGLDFIVQ